MKEIKKMIATFKTADFVANLKAALLAACEDVTRSWMCCVRIELAAGVARFVATNGHWLWVNETNYIEVVGVDALGKKEFGMSSATVTIPLADVRAILKGLDKGKKAAGWDVDLDTSGNVAQIGKATTFAPVKEDKFPPYAQVIPSGVVPTKHAIAFDPTYISDVMAAFREVSSSCGGVVFEQTGGEIDPVVVTSDTSCGLAVLMPCRHDGKPQGSAMVARYRGETARAKKVA
jgi:hypothetical protein